MSSASEYKTLGNKEFQSGNFQKAVECFSKAIELDPTDHVFYSNRSGAYASMNQYQDAYEDAAKCVELKPDWAKGYQRKGLAEFYLKKYDDAIQTYEQGLQIDPNNQQLQEGLQRAQQEKSGGPQMDQFTQQLLMKLLSNPKTAEYLKDPEFVQKLTSIQKNPALLMEYMNDPKMKDAFGVMFGEMPQFQQGMNQNFHQSKEEEQKEQKNEYQEFTKKSEPERKEQPKKTSNQQMNLKPDEEAKQQGNELFKKKKFQEALEFYNKAIELNKSEVLYYTNKAACYIEMKDFDSAQSTVDEALKVADELNLKDFSKIAKIWARKGNIHMHKKEYKKAIECYDKSLLEDNQYKVKEELKRAQKLFKDEEALLYINPELAEEHNQKAKDFFLAGNFPDAMKQYDEAIRRNPKDPKLYANKATCLIKLMEFPNALRELDKCLELDPNYVKAFAKKGNCHFAMKEYHKALDFYEKGLKMDQNNQECKDGIYKTRSKIMTGGSEQEQEERARHAMADPEIQNILRDPQVQLLLKNMTENPHHPDNIKAFTDPQMGPKIQKLIQSGVLKTG